MWGSLRKNFYVGDVIWFIFADIEPSQHRKIAFFSVSEGNERVKKYLYRTYFFAKTSYYTFFDYAQQLPIVF
jgi:hypothetical protein